MDHSERERFADDTRPATLAQEVFDLAVSMNRQRAAEIRAEPPVAPTVRTDADRLYALYRRITDNNDGNVFGASYEHDWLGTIEGYIEKLEELTYDARAQRRAVRTWIEAHSNYGAIDLQQLADAVGVNLRLPDHRDNPTTGTTADPAERSSDSRRLDRA